MYSNKLPHQLKTDAEMIPEVEVIQHVDNIMLSILVLGPEMVEDAHLYERLVVEPLLVADDLDGDMLVGAVV